MNATPIEFCRLAKGNCFTVWRPAAWLRGDVFEKTGIRTGWRCDVTRPVLRMSFPARTLICWYQNKEAA